MINKRIIQRALCAVLAVLAVAVILPVISAAVRETNMTFTVDKSSVKPGETVTVEIGCKDMTVCSFNGGVAFDKNKLICTSIVGTGSGGGVLLYDADGKEYSATAVSGIDDANKAGTVGVSFANTSDRTYVEHLILTATFTVRVGAVGNLDFVLYEDTDGQNAFRAALSSGGCETKTVRSRLSDSSAGDPTVSKTVAQRYTDGGISVRFIAALKCEFENGSCSEYTKVGFEITASDRDHSAKKTVEYSDNLVYNSIGGINSSDVGINNGKMFCLTIRNAAQNADFEIRAFAVKADGGKVYGVKRHFSLSDGELTIVSSDNLALNAAVTDSGKELYSESQTPDKTVDGDKSTGWQYKDSDLTDVWIRYDFSEPVTASMIKIVWEAATRATDEGYEVQYSEDGIAWYPLPNAVYTHGDTSVIEFEPFEISYLRLYITEGTDNKYPPQIYEFEVYMY